MSAREKSELFGGAAGRTQKPSTTASTSTAPSGASRTSGMRTAAAIAPDATRANSDATKDRHAQQRKEAFEARTVAEGYMTKTWKRWQCDYFSAAPYFEKAAAAYRACGDDDAAANMFFQAGECQVENSAWALAAKDYREAAQIVLKQGDDRRASELYHSAAAAWASGAEPGKAGEYLGKSAAILEGRDEDAAAAEYKLAVDTMVPEGCSPHSTDFIKIIGAREVFDAALRFLLGARRFSEALHVLRRFCVFLQAEDGQHTLHKMFLTEAVVLLASGDYVAADRAYKESHLQESQYLSAAECKVEEDLLTAFKNYDVEALSAAQSDRALLRLDASVVRLAAALTIDGMGDMESHLLEAEKAAEAAKPFGGILDSKARIAALTGISPKPAAAAAAARSTNAAGGAQRTEARAMPPVPPPRQAAATTADKPAAAAAATSASHDATEQSDDYDGDLNNDLDNLHVADDAQGDDSSSDIDLDAEIARAKAEAAAGDTDAPGSSGHSSSAVQQQQQQQRQQDDDDEIDLT